MQIRASGVFKRSELERSDQRVSWERSDRAFFASGACHVLAWACRDIHDDLDIGIAGLVRPGADQVFHVYATCGSWAFDHSGWQPSTELRGVNADFEQCAIASVAIETTFDAFCARHHHRPIADFWTDPSERAKNYVEQFARPPA